VTIRNETQQTVQAAATIAAAAGRFVAAKRTLPDTAKEAALRCLLDWTGVAVAGADTASGRLAHSLAARWASRGSSPILFGGTAASAVAAFVNSTYAHAHDFDDTHIPTDAHFSGPTWAATLAVGSAVGASGAAMIDAFVTGFETGAKLGGRRLGHAMQARGFQPTGLMGRLSAAAAAACLLELGAERAAHALAIAATQTAGLTGAVGSMGKPLQGGKSAMEGVLAAELAAEGMVGAPGLLEAGGGLARALVQDGTAEIADPKFEDGWEILRNSFKPYACLHGIHPSIDAARDLAPRIAGRPLNSVRVEVAPGVARIGGIRAPKTPLQGKFSVAFCVALGLAGRSLMPADFTEQAVADPGLRDIVKRIDVVPVDGRKMIDSRIVVRLEDGEELDSDIPLSWGHPGNPMDRTALEEKFDALVRPVLGDAAAALCAALAQFDRPGRMEQVFALLGPRRGQSGS